MFLLNTYHRFLLFLRKPDQGSYRRMGAIFKTSTFFSLLLLNVVFAIIWLSIYHLISKETLDSVQLIPNLIDFWVFMLLIILLGPLLEEVIFRLPMKYSRNYLLRFFVYLVGLFCSEEAKESLDSRVKNGWRKYFWVFFYVMSSTFAFVHIFNYTDYKHLLLWSPLLTLVQLLLGLIIGYLRIRFGFLWGWFYHGIYNLLMINLLLIYSGVNPWSQRETNFRPHYLFINKIDKVIEVKIGNPDFKTYRVNNSDYSLKISKVKEYHGVCSGFGVTTSRIFFDIATADYILKTISYNQKRVHDPDSLLFSVELQMKSTSNSSEKARDILEKEMFRALSLK